MCILVTSGGKIAAPGPNLMASNWEKGQLNVLVVNGFAFVGDIVPSAERIC
jgi:hypothetical protein